MELREALQLTPPTPPALSLLVRLALESDEDVCVGLARMQTAETLPHIPFHEPAARKTFQRYLDTANPTIFVCEDVDRSVIGFLVATMSSYAFATGLCVNQEVIYVRPDKRHTRAAPSLIREFDAWADRLDAREVFTGISNGFKAERTTRLFERFGYQPVGTYLRRIRRHG